MKIFYVTQTFPVRLDHLLSVVSFINKPCDSVGRVSAPRATMAQQEHSGSPVRPGCCALMIIISGVNTPVGDAWRPDPGVVSGRNSQPSAPTNLQLECWYVYKPAPAADRHLCLLKVRWRITSKTLVPVAEVNSPVSSILNVLPVTYTAAISARYVAIWLSLFFTVIKAPELIMIRRLFPPVFVPFQVGLHNAPDCGSTAAFA
jgi:hypothetical protein